MKQNQFVRNPRVPWILGMLFLCMACFHDSFEKSDLTPPAELEEAEEVPFDSDANFRINSADQNKLVASIRSATAKFHRLEVALENGYAQSSGCVTRPGAGGMGFHFSNPGLIDLNIDPTKPEVLLYEPQKNGQMRLVAVEFIVPATPWDNANSDPPKLGNQEFDDHRDFTKGGPPFPHYQLHVWVWKNNPNGLYTQFNPNVNCDYAPNNGAPGH